MDLTIIADLLSSINPIVLGGAAGGVLVVGGAALYVKRNKNKFIENTDPLAQSNDFKTLKTEDLEREFGSLTVQTKILDEDESLFFDKTPKDKVAEPELTQPSTKLVDEASVFDSFGKQEQAIESLKKAIEIEKHDKEKVRLKILLSQYNNKKGKTSLDEIIKEYPSFHAKVSFGPENTVSALMGSPTPKSDAVVKTNINKEIDKDFDIFADLPVLSDTPKVKVAEQKSEVIVPNKNIFDDLPTLQEVTTPTPISDTSKAVVHNNDLAFFEEKKEPVLPDLPVLKSSSHDIFADLPPLDSHVEPVIEKIVAPETKEEVKPVDQFSWNTSTPALPTVEDETENMLKALQKDADHIDQINENEAIDDMQKFWKEFGSMVVDIKNEVADNHKLIKNDPIPELQEKAPIAVEEVKVSIPDLPPVTPTPVVQEPIFSIVKNEPVLPPVVTEVKPVEPPVLREELKEPVIPPVAVETPKVFKVWANWIVNIEGQQVFRNHFVNLKNAWGTAQAGEELYMGITKLSGKTPAGKSYPWVLVSVFPLTKE